MYCGRPREHSEDGKGFSTRLADSTSRISSQRSFQQYRQHSQQHASQPALNMNDCRSRIQRQYHQIYQKSTQESKLFDKGLKKITPVLSEQPSERGISRGYANGQSWNLINPKPLPLNKMSEGGVKRINLYDQRKESNSSREFSGSRTKRLGNCNDESHPTDGTSLYLVKKMPTHVNSHPVWLNSAVHLHFNKKQNLNNKENMSLNFIPKQEEKAGPHKKIVLHKNKKSTINNSECGITSDQQGIDFRQNYFQKQTERVQPAYRSGWATERRR